MDYLAKKEENKIIMEKEYNDMENGIKEPTKNHLLSKDLEGSRILFKEQGFKEIEDIEEMMNEKFQGKKARYILKNGKVRSGGRVSRIVLDSDPRFIYFRPFFLNGIFKDGWSVDFNDIKYLYIADIVRRKKVHKTIDDPEIKTFLDNVMKNTEHKKVSNKNKLFKYIRDNYSDDKKTLGLTRNHVFAYYKHLNKPKVEQKRIRVRNKKVKTT